MKINKIKKYPLIGFVSIIIIGTWGCWFGQIQEHTLQEWLHCPPLNQLTG
jgi:hypothetical protein